MKNVIKNMKGRNRVKKSTKKVRITISIDDDVYAKGLERMAARRAASFSNYAEILFAEDTGLLAKPAEVAA